MILKTARRNPVCVLDRCRSNSSHSRIANKPSHRALSDWLPPRAFEQHILELRYEINDMTLSGGGPFLDLIGAESDQSAKSSQSERHVTTKQVGVACRIFSPVLLLRPERRAGSESSLNLFAHSSSRTHHEHSR